MNVAEMARIHAAAFAGAAPPPWSADEIGGALFSAGARAVTLPGIGFAILRAAAGEAELWTLAVDPAHRRRGHGAALLAMAEDAMRGAGAAEAFLEVAEGNAAARALYAAAGWREVGRRPRYYGEEGALILRKPL